MPIVCINIWGNKNVLCIDVERVMLAVSHFLAKLSTLNVPVIMGSKGSCACRIWPNYESFEIRYIEN